MVNKKAKELGSKPSVIRDLFEYGKKRKQEIGDKNVFDFSIGNPSVPTPQKVTDSLIDILKSTEPTILHGYTSAVGDKSVRDEISNYLNKTYRANTSGDFIYLTCGAASSLSISLNAILNKGDEVVVFAPFFPEYLVFIEKAGGVVKIVNPVEPSFKPNFDELEKVITNKTKAVILNSPNNPTGVVLKSQDIERLATILNKKQKEFDSEIYLISDEPYRELLYVDIEYPFVTNFYQNSIVCYSFSKSISLPGERIGYILVNPNCKDVKDLFYAICGAGRALGFVCAPALFQYLIPHCLGLTADIDIYKQNRDLLYNALTNFGYEVVKPDGAFYLFVKSPSGDATELYERAKKHEVLVVPCDDFGVKGYVRIAYCVDKQRIINSLPAFKKIIESY